MNENWKANIADVSRGMNAYVQQPDVTEEAVKMFPNTAEMYAKLQYLKLQRAKAWLKENYRG